MLLLFTGQQLIYRRHGGRHLGGGIRKLDRGKDRPDDTHGKHDRGHENIGRDTARNIHMPADRQYRDQGAGRDRIAESLADFCLFHPVIVEGCVRKHFVLELLK